MYRRSVRLTDASTHEVRNQPRGDVRAGDVIVAVSAKGATTDIKSAKQFNELLASLDKGTLSACSSRFERPRGDFAFAYTTPGGRCCGSLRVTSSRQVLSP